MPDNPPLISIHGISTNGEWQENLRPVFAPHFRYFPIKYPHYRRFGALKVVLEPVVLIVAGVAVALTTGLALTAIVLLALLVAYLATALRRRWAFMTVLRQFDAQVVVGERAYVVAHSFGTYLCGRLLRTRATARCSRVVFTGSVLSRDFPAILLASRERMPFEDLRNEIGMSDLVPRIAGLIRRLVPHLGDAGVRGFAPTGPYVHDVGGPDLTCDRCHDTSQAAWLVHNVRIRESAHSDQFITRRHAVQFWLPFLWKIDIPEFTEWLEHCRLATRATMPSVHAPAALEAERRLIARSWRWAGSTIRDFVTNEYPASTKRFDDPLWALRFYRALWGAVARACEHAESHGDDPDLMAQARALDPRVAVQVAVGVAQS